MAYRLLVSIEVIEFIERLPVKTREALRFAIHSFGGDFGGDFGLACHRLAADLRDNLGGGEGECDSKFRIGLPKWTGQPSVVTLLNH